MKPPKMTMAADPNTALTGQPSSRTDPAAPDDAAALDALALEVELRDAWLTIELGRTTDVADREADEVVLALLDMEDMDPEAEVEGRVTVTLESVTGFSSAVAH
jgi:hypothetical protein